MWFTQKHLLSSYSVKSGTADFIDNILPVLTLQKYKWDGGIMINMGMQTMLSITAALIL